MRLQEDAKSIKEALTIAHSEHKSRQTTKILSDFEVGLTNLACSEEAGYFVIMAASLGGALHLITVTSIDVVTAGGQATLKDFQATMKAAKAKEAASLPRRPEPSRQFTPQDLEQGGVPQEAERTALLQASSP